MVPAPGTTAQQRWRALVAQNNISKGLFASTRLSQPPKITYGKKNTPLSLTGMQFRPSAYDITSDGEAEQSSPLFVERGRETDEDESVLSDAGDSLQDSPPAETRSEADGRSRAGIVVQQESVEVARRSNAKTLITADVDYASRRRAPDKAKGVERPRQTKVNLKSKSQNRKNAIARRLPVNELFLVASPPNYPDNDPQSSCPGVKAQDPISGFSSSPHKRAVSPIDSYNDQTAHKAVKTPLTAIRWRIQTSKLKHKSLTTARRPKDETRSLLMRNDHVEPRGSDGFDASERLITSHPIARRRRIPRAPLVLKFDALELKSGPLPDVDFEPSIKLELQTQDHEADGVLAGFSNDSHSHEDVYQAQSQHPRPRVSFSSALRNEAIRAQLLSISAPERESSESEEDDTEDNDDDDVEESGSDNETGTDFASANEDGETTVVEEDAGELPRNLGVTIDFRRPEMHGQSSITKSRQRRNLMEVPDSIVEVPDTSPTRSAARLRISQPQQQRLHIQTQHRPRSILKNSTPMIPDSTSMPEQTAANTRRNSTVNLDESHYFTSASNAPNQPDPARHVIIPRRSSHFNFVEVEVPDSDGMIPLTSPEKLQSANDYTVGTQLNVLRRDAEAVWMSAATAPDKPRDLKTITRAVSREHGTLSQSVRRRPSLSFSSPTKMQ